jgi:hypothetical protein
MTGMRYVNDDTVPKSIGPSRKLMHNHVRHTWDTPCGTNSFRAWTDTKVPAGFIRCPCGWSGLPHYASRRQVEASKGKCDTLEELERLMPGTMDAVYKMYDRILPK